MRPLKATLISLTSGGSVSGRVPMSWLLSTRKFFKLLGRLGGKVPARVHRPICSDQESTHLVNHTAPPLLLVVPLAYLLCVRMACDSNKGPLKFCSPESLLLWASKKRNAPWGGRAGSAPERLLSCKQTDVLSGRVIQTCRYEVQGTRAVCISHSFRCNCA